MPSRASQAAFWVGADARNPEKRKDSFRGAKRTISRRRRKPLRSLAARNAVFRGIHCFQWLHLHFVSHRRRESCCGRADEKPGQRRRRFLKNNTVRRRLWQEIVGFLSRAPPRLASRLGRIADLAIMARLRPAGAHPGRSRLKPHSPATILIKPRLGANDRCRLRGDRWGDA